MVVRMRAPFSARAVHRRELRSGPSTPVPSQKAKTVLALRHVRALTSSSMQSAVAPLAWKRIEKAVGEAERSNAERAPNLGA